jgi:hypothetical protein
MLVYIYLMCAVMNCNTLSARKIRMTNFAETARKEVTKSLCDKQKSATGVHGVDSKVRWKILVQWGNSAWWKTTMGDLSR